MFKTICKIETIETSCKLPLRDTTNDVVHTSVTIYIQTPHRACRCFCSGIPLGSSRPGRLTTTQHSHGAIQKATSRPTTQEQNRQFCNDSLVTHYPCIRSPVLADLANQNATEHFRSFIRNSVGADREAGMPTGGQPTQHNSASAALCRRIRPKLQTVYVLIK